MIDWIEYGDPAAPAVVLCHGFGANMHDLAGLTGALSLGRPVRWVFPQAPVELPGYPAGRAWFPSDPTEFLAFASGELFSDLSGLDPSGLRQSGRLLLDLLDRIGSPVSRTVIGGFSQGSMVALEAALAASEPPAGLVVLSGSIIAGDRWRKAGAARERPLDGLPVFQSHGAGDPILPYAQAVRLGELLDACGAKRRFVRFGGGHEIPPAVTEPLTDFLEDALPPAGR